MRLFHRRPAEPETDGLSLLVGLGNPGSRYEGTRHNVGFMVVDRLAERHGLDFRGSKQRADVARGTIGGVACLLAKPVTFMNDSGFAVSHLLAYYRIPTERLLVICDDLDLPFGTLRIRPGGSAGGQRGLQSIVQMLGTQEFARLRLGIGRPPSQAVSYVLGRFPPEEEAQLPGLLDTAGEAAVASVRDGPAAAMNAYNRNWLPT